jgi:hypothetical protein
MKNRIYHRTEDGRIEITYAAQSKASYLAELNDGIPAGFHRTKTGEEDLLGWPDARVEWWGNVGFPVKPD